MAVSFSGGVGESGPLRSKCFTVAERKATRRNMRLGKGAGALPLPWSFGCSLRPVITSPQIQLKPIFRPTPAVPVVLDQSFLLPFRCIHSNLPDSNCSTSSCVGFGTPLKRAIIGFLKNEVTLTFYPGPFCPQLHTAVTISSAFSLHRFFTLEHCLRSGLHHWGALPTVASHHSPP